MGFFTWTDAKRQPRILKNGDYAAMDKIGYGAIAKVVCPDNSIITEPYYEGYGLFDDNDIYDLVVDWNKNQLDKIFDDLAAKDPKHWGYTLHDIAIAYMNGASNDELMKMAQELADSDDPYVCVAAEWKRVIGITISAGENNKNLPYPIKITTRRRGSLSYTDLEPSLLCQ